MGSVYNSNLLTKPTTCQPSVNQLINTERQPMEPNQNILIELNRGLRLNKSCLVSRLEIILLGDTLILCGSVPLNEAIQSVSVSGYVKYGAIKYDRARSGFISIECQSVLETVSGKHFPISWTLIRCTTLQSTQLYRFLFTGGGDRSMEGWGLPIEYIPTSLIFTAVDSRSNMMNWLTHEFPSGKRICIHVQVWPVPVPVTGFSLNLNRVYPRIAQFKRTSVYTDIYTYIYRCNDRNGINYGRSVGGALAKAKAKANFKRAKNRCLS